MASNWVPMLKQRSLGSTKDPKQCVPSFCGNNPFHSVIWESGAFHCLANFDLSEQTGFLANLSRQAHKVSL